MPSTGEYPLSLFTTVRQALQILEGANVEPNKFLQAIIDDPAFRTNIVKTYKSYMTTPLFVLPSEPHNVGRLLKAIIGNWELEQNRELVERYAKAKDFIGLFEGLAPRTVSIIVMYFGLDNGQVQTLSVVGRYHGISGSRTQQLVSNALSKMRRNWKGAALSSVIPSQELLDSDIRILELSERPLYCLRRNMIDTIRVLLTKSEDDLLSMTNFGYRSLTEVNEKLAERDLSLMQ